MKILEYKKKLNEVAEIPEAIKCLFSEAEESRYAKEEFRDAKFGYKVLQPLIRVGIYALSQECSFLSDVIDYLDDLSNDDDLSPYYTTNSLDSRELFRCLKLLDEKCLWIVLKRIKNLSIAENLKIAVLNNDFDVFRSIIYKKEVNTDPITPVCNLLYLKIRMDELNNWVEEKRQQADSLPDEESEETREWIREFLLQYSSENHKITNDLNLHKERTPITDIYFEKAERTFLDDDFDMNKEPPSVRDMVVYSSKKAYPSFVENSFSLNEYTDNKYKVVLGDFCVLKRDLRSLSTVAKVVMEGILKAEEFRPIWSRFEEFDDNTIDVLEKEHDDFLLKHGIPIDEDGSVGEKAPSKQQIEEPREKTNRGDENPTSIDSEIQDFKDSTPQEKAKVLIPIIEELLDKLDGQENVFLVDCDLGDLKSIFEGILTGNAKENGAVQQAIIDELSGTDHNDITPQYYYKNRLWLQPFFIIIGRLFKKEVLKGGQTAFVRALFPEKRGRDLEYGVVYKEEDAFIQACRAKVSFGNNIETKMDTLAMRWRKYITWIDECAG